MGRKTLLPLSAAARAVGLTPYRVRRLLEQRRINGQPAGPLIMIDPEELRRQTALEREFSLSVSDTARLLGITWEKAMSLIERGELRAQRIDGRWRVAPASLPEVR